MDASISVLVVDDEFYVCRSVQKILAAESIDADMATSGPEGLVKARSRKYDVIMVDIKMPEMNGFEFIRILREIDPGVPVVVISGYNTPQMKEQSLEHTAVRFIPKPFTPEDVRDVVLELLQERAATAGAGGAAAQTPVRDPKNAAGYACAVILENEGVIVPAEKQKERIKKFAGSKNLKLLDIYEDVDRSADILERPAMKRLLESETRAGAVVIDHIWALSRRREKLLSFLRALDEKGMKLEIATTMMDVASQFVRAWKEHGAAALGEDGER